MANPVTIIGLTVLGVVLAVCVIALASDGVIRFARRGGWVLLALAVAMTLFGGKKNFMRGLRNDGSYATNGLHIAWKVDPNVYVPLSAPVYIDYRPSGMTNEEWGLLGQSVVSAYHFDIDVGSGDTSWTNYDYNVWWYYVPPEPVHTNGVWEYRTKRDRRDDGILPLRARIKDEEDAE